MSQVISPIGDRLLVKLVRLSEKQVGKVTLTLANDVRKRYQAECSKAEIIAGGLDVPPGLGAGSVVLIRSDAGVGLTSDVVANQDARLYRVIEYPEVLAVIKEDCLISDANEVGKQMEVLA